MHFGIIMQNKGVQMRFRVLVEGEHSEGLEARERFLGIVDRFMGELCSNGFCGHSEATVDHREPGPYVTSTSAEATPAEFHVASYPSPGEMTDAGLRDAIKALRGNNRILSQEELAKRLGVSRYRIRKVLGGA